MKEREREKKNWPACGSDARPLSVYGAGFDSKGELWLQVILERSHLNIARSWHTVLTVGGCATVLVSSDCGSQGCPAVESYHPHVGNIRCNVQVWRFCFKCTFDVADISRADTSSFQKKRVYIRCNCTKIFISVEHPFPRLKLWRLVASKSEFCTGNRQCHGSNQNEFKERHLLNCMRTVGFHRRQKRAAGPSTANPR